MWYRRFIASAVMAAVLAGAGATGAAAATPSTAPISAASVSAVGYSSAATSTTGPSSTVASTPAPGSAAPAGPAVDRGASTEQVGPVARQIVNWLRQHARGFYNSMRDAVKRGFNAFVAWYKDLPGWVRKGIENVGGPILLADLYDQLKNIL